MKRFKPFFTVAMAFFTLAATAQTAPPTDKTDSAVKPCVYPVQTSRCLDTRPTETFYLANASQPNVANEILTAIRIMLDPEVRAYLSSSRNAITLHATPEQIAQARSLIAALDRPTHAFRLTYTVTESDAGQRIGIQHFAMIATSGTRTNLKQGSRIPIVTAPSTGKEGGDTQITYLDVGLNLDATVEDFAGGVSLKSKVEQSTLAPERSGVGQGDPIVRQAVLEGTSLLTLGKPQVLGSLDVPCSTRHLDIEVLAEQIK